MDGELTSTARWLLSFIPFIVTSAAGGTLISYANPTNERITLVVSLMCWSVGISVSCLIYTIYLWYPLSIFPFPIPN